MYVYIHTHCIQIYMCIYIYIYIYTHTHIDWLILCHVISRCVPGACVFTSWTRCTEAELKATARSHVCTTRKLRC